LVGAGPGDPELITLKGIKLLKTCDVVIYDRLASEQLLEYLKDDCIKIYVGKSAGNHSKKQEEINQIIVENAIKYNQIVRLKGGDPFVFGRGGEEIEELIRNHIPYEVIPGITSAISVPSSVGIPVTHRGLSQSFHVITGHTSSTEDTLTNNYEVLAKLDGTLVFLMGLSNLERIVHNLIQHGKEKNTPVAIISGGTTIHEKVVRGTLDNIVGKLKEETILSPAIITIGKTAALQLVLNDQKTNLKIGITATQAMFDKLEISLRNLNVKAYSICNMQVEETPFIEELMNVFQYINSYNWIVFTSQNAISLFFKKMNEYSIDRRTLSHVKFAVIGSGTKEALEKYGYYADFIPSKYTTMDLALELSEIVTKQDKLFIPRALQGSEELTKILIEKRIDFKELSIYDVKGKVTEHMNHLIDMDCLIFASASGVTALFQELQRKGISLPQNIKIVCIGEATAHVIRKFNREVDMIANINNMDGILNEIKKLFSL
jgi:uroporphyrinogen III methyltransferase/synthase